MIRKFVNKYRTEGCVAVRGGFFVGLFQSSSIRYRRDFKGSDLRIVQMVRRLATPETIRYFRRSATGCKGPVAV